jgi:hypothetical protein
MNATAKTFAQTLLGSFSKMDPEARAAIMEAIRETAAENAPGDSPEEVVALQELADASDVVRAGEQVAVTAAGNGESRIRRMATAAGRPTPSPEAVAPHTGAVLTASGVMPGIASQVIEDPWELAVSMSEFCEGMPKDGKKVIVASARWDHLYPEERRLNARDWAHNERQFARVIGSKSFLSLPPAALVASGGVCAPANVDFSIPGWSTADRPIRDALPQFLADRGGLTYVPPANIATYSGATTVWSEATDASPGAATKPVVQVVCGSPVTVFVNAIPTRLGIGNMLARMAPEQLAQANELAMSQAARTAEIELLQLIAASCVADVTSATLLGATRDFITVIRQVVDGYRSLYRIPKSVKFTAIFPDWVRGMIAIDRAREIGHGEDGSLMVTDQQIDDMLGVCGVNPVWHIDGQSAAQLSGAGGVAQIFPAQSASGAVNPYPTVITWYIFPEGAFQFLDAGRLDLGVVRDSVLDSTNDLESFVESFEGLAFRGFASGALQMSTTTGALGGTAGTVSTAGHPA